MDVRFKIAIHDLLVYRTFIVLIFRTVINLRLFLLNFLVPEKLIAFRLLALEILNLNNI